MWFHSDILSLRCFFVLEASAKCNNSDLSHVRVHWIREGAVILCGPNNSWPYLPFGFRSWLWEPSIQKRT